jgi:TP901 family phage tail tape measure protein
MATIRDRYVLEVDTSGAQRGVGGVGGAIGGLTSRLRGLGPLIAGAAAGLAAFGTITAIQNTIDDFDELAKRARSVGAANEESFQSFQVLSAFLGEAGIAAGETDAALTKLSVAVSQNEAGTQKFVDIFDKLGDAARDANGDILPIPELFGVVAAAVQDGTLTMADATDLFGRGAGTNLVNLFQDMAENGTQVADALADVAQNTNIVDIEAARNAEVFNDNIGRLKAGLNQLMTDAITPLLPILVDLSERVLAAMPGVIEGVRSAFAALSPVFNLIGTVLTELVFPILSAVFDILGSLAGVITPIAEFALPALTRAFEFVVTIVTSVVDTVRRLIETLGEFAERARAIKDGVSGAFTEMRDNVSSRASEMSSNVTGFFSDMYNRVVGNSIVPDMVDGVIREFAVMNQGMTQQTSQAVSAVEGNFGRLSGIVSSVISSVSGSGNSIFESLNQLFNLNAQNSPLFNGLQQIGQAIQGVTGQAGGLSNALRGLGSVGGGLSQIGGGIGGGIGNALGSIGGIINTVSNIGNLFAGFFADGGFIPRGQFGVVGERGPELVSGPAQITPLNGLGGGSVTYNINAVDARSFRDLLATDPGYIHALAQAGANKLPGRF